MNMVGRHNSVAMNSIADIFLISVARTLNQVKVSQVPLNTVAAGQTNKNQFVLVVRSAHVVFITTLYLPLTRPVSLRILNSQIRVLRVMAGLRHNSLVCNMAATLISG